MPTPPPYAPTSTSNPSFNFVTSQLHPDKFDHELDLSHIAETTLDSLSELYSIIKTINILEKMYVRDLIPVKEWYTNTTLRLLNQYLTLLGNRAIQDEFGTLESFVRTYDLDVPLAVTRLERGVPATLENGTLRASPNSGTATPVGSDVPGRISARAVSSITGAFITCLDNIKLKFLKKENLHSSLANIITQINSANGDGNDLNFPGKSKLITWLIKINQLANPYDELSEEDADEFMTDVSYAMEGFVESLEG
ncbi:hypothetical protein BABINDRAFT_161576 [Babjeviella inositovora NRRL Y-12698]|uniref:Vacuolar protein sorting-associated protein 28 n=1 Tax=Babjeviella inositovora NRRL Y-12698 TaxID=984486 RepID=A0A1E3QQI5_9ASCO|nr:uncharacterized protein BABINDRAFT_161576 [Babjeviella inositovora NRRL Y-12698]ODQ79908.1 hypothetical protein BABINDRAFT_161576 [Babjeviella inositovora NRRL Y-12698]